MKNKIRILLMLFYIFSCGIHVYAISDDFKFVIETVGIPQYNVYNQEINEEVYYIYNVFCYSSPKEASINASQTFKPVSQGKWTEDDVKYTGIGIPGEYYYIGRAYNGSLISNVRYPVSFFPETTPNNWNYLVVNGALQSWQDESKYKYYEQLEYMKTTSMLFDRLDFQNKVTNPYDLIDYGINAQNIGLNKITLDACSTWKTYGVLTSVRRETNGAIRYAIFATSPMAASASVKSNINVDSTYTVKENEKSKSIVIEFGAEAINLTNYAKEDHIKEIKANLYINGKLVSSISANKQLKVKKDYILILNRETEESYPLNIEVKSTLYTEFSVDGLMQDGLSKKVNIIFERYKSILENAEIKLLNMDKDKYVVSELIKTKVTNSGNSLGIIQAGNHLAIKVNTDYDEKDINLFINGEKQIFKKIYKSEGSIILDCIIKESFITINGWNSLRNSENSYFKVKENEIGNRIKRPNQLKIIISDKEKILNFDCMDKYNINMNYNLYGVINKEGVNKKNVIEKW